MKKVTLSLTLAFSIVSTLYAQDTGWFGIPASAGGSGEYCHFFGINSGENTNTSGTGNSFFGHNSGRANTTGIANTAMGREALSDNTTGTYNSCVGAWTLDSNTTGWENSAFGYAALTKNTNGYSNTATGYAALYWNSTASNNTASGTFSSYTNTTGTSNVSIGYKSAYLNSTGNENVAVGYMALYTNTGSGNTAAGYQALYTNSTGINNSAFGHGAGPNSTNYSNTTALGNGAVTTANDQVRIGNSSVSSIGGQVSWSTLSDGRFKREVKQDVSGLNFIDELRPVSYTVDIESFNTFIGAPNKQKDQNPEARQKASRQIGFIAQEVEEIVKKTGYVFSGVEAPQSEKDHYSIRYSEFVVPLVKAVQELHTQTIEQQKKIDLLLDHIINNRTLDNKEIVSHLGGVLFQNTPNPFSNDTEIRMSLPENTRVASIIIYDLGGKQLKSMLVTDRGNVSVKVTGYEFNPGMYLYTLIVDGKVLDTKRMILTK